MIPSQNHDFEGTTAECFSDFVNRFNEFDDQRIIADIAGVSYSSTFRPWVRNGVVAKGEKLVRIRAVMELFGYHVSEWRNLLPALRVLADAIAFGVKTPQQAYSDLQYKNINDLYRVLLNDSAGMLPERQDMVAWYAQEIGIDTNRRRQEIITHIKTKSSRLARGLTGQTIQNEQVGVVLTDTIEIDILDANLLTEVFEGLVRSMLPIAELLVSDALTLDERKKIRDRVGRGKIATLNGLVDALTSEQNRDRYLSKQGKERIGS